MPHFTFVQTLGQLEKQKGGYYYLEVSSETVDQLPKKRATRLKCEIDKTVSYSCGLNHLGDGNFFIIVATKHLNTLQKGVGDTVLFQIYEDPNPLGVDIPESLQALLDQDEELLALFETLTDGKKRSLIYTVKGVKDIDLQVQKALKFFEEQKTT